MKGTNPETQGHRWAKRVKKRLKRERIEEGQWEELEQRKWDAFNAARDAKEAAEEGDSRHVPPDGSSSDEEPSEWNASAGDAGTSLRDEEGLDPEEAAAVRAVKAAAAAAAARLARLDDDDDDEKRLNRRARRPDASSAARRAPAARASSNPYAALGGPPRAARPADRRASVDLPDGQHPNLSTAATFVSTTAVSEEEHRAHRAAEGLAAARAKKQTLGVVGRAGASAKKHKKALKRARRAAAAR